MPLGRQAKAALILALALPAALPALAASDPRLSVTGAIENLPTQWGDPRIPPMATPIMPAAVSAPASTPEPVDPFPLDIPVSSGSSARTPVEGAPLSALDLAIAALGPRGTAADQATTDAPQVASGPTAQDQISGIVVRAAPRPAGPPTVERCFTGPAWWRVTKGPATLWIMGTPDQMPMNTVWDDTCLNVRMKGARLVIVPASPLMSASDPLGRAETPLRAETAPLDKLLPGSLWKRLSWRIADNPIRAKAEADWARSSNAQVVPPGLTGGASVRTTLQVLRDIPDLYAPPVVVAARLAKSLDLPGRLGNPAADRAVALANRMNMLTGRTQNSEAEFAGLTYLSAPTEAEQEACLDKVLTALDAGQTGLWRLNQIQAWADGDEANALRRMNVIDTCSLGDISVRFWSALVAQDMDLIDRAMAQPGIVVAVLEYDPMFLKGGVLERLLAEGYTVTPPEALQ